MQTYEHGLQMTMYASGLHECRPVEATEKPPKSSAGAGAGHEAPGLKRHAKKTRRRRLDRHNQAALDNVVFAVLGRDDALLGVDALKGLRQVSRTFRDLVDASAALPTAKFSHDPQDACGSFDDLATWAAGGPWMKRTRRLVISGGVPPSLLQAVVAAIETHRPPISSLQLHPWAAWELAAPLGQLRELSLHNDTFQSVPLGALSSGAAFKGLRSLRLSKAAVTGDDLIAALAALPELQHLKMWRVCVIKSPEEPGALANGLKRLETVVLKRCHGVDRMGLFGAALPSLRAFAILKGDKMSMPAASWLSRLTELRLHEVCVTTAAVAATLSGGPLEKLHLSLAGGAEAYDYWKWGSPGELAAFPRLRELSLTGGGPGEDGLLKVLASDVVPRLEVLSLCLSRSVPELVPRVTQALLSQGTPPWPRLRELHLEVGGRLRVAYSHQVHLFRALYHVVAPRCPGPTALSVKMGHRLNPDALEAFLDGARAAQAWPLLRRMSMNYKGALVKDIKEVWPDLVFKKQREAKAKEAA